MSNGIQRNVSGGTPPDKKKVLILLGLGVVIIFVYKTAVLDKPQPDATVSEVQESTSAEPVSPSSETIAPQTALARAEEKRSPINLSWGRDPFMGFYGAEEKPSLQQVPVSTNISVVQKKPEQEPLILSGIGWSRNRSLAIINGQVVHEGDTVTQGKKGYKVISILKNRVVVDANGKTIILRVRGGG